jgi:hypothetical protein
MEYLVFFLTIVLTVLFVVHGRFYTNSRRFCDGIVD